MTAPDELPARIAAAIPRTLVSNPGITRELADRVLAAVPELADAAANAAAVARVRALAEQWRATDRAVGSNGRNHGDALLRALDGEATP